MASLSPTQTPGLARKIGIGVLGLALGLGAAVAVGVHRHSDERAASVHRLTLPAGNAQAATAPAQLGSTRPVAAGSAREAVQRFFDALARGDLATSYNLLDQASRATGKYDSLARWTDAQNQRTPVSSVRVGSDKPVDSGAVDVTVELRHPASIDPYAGLVPGRTLEVWRTHKEAGGWRVASDPSSVQALLPSDRLAPGAVNSWVGKLVGCDQQGAAGLQVDADLYGQASLAQAPCKLHGHWTAAAAQPFSAVSDPTPYVAAFGAEVSSWARVIPVQGPGSHFAAVVGPLGDGWRVIGVDAGQG